MAWGVVAGAAITTVGGLVASNQQRQAAKGAANAQKSGTNAALAETQRQFDIQMQEYQRKTAQLEKQQAQITTQLAPYVQGGQSAFYEMLALTGMAPPAGATTPATTTTGGATSLLKPQIQGLPRGISAGSLAGTMAPTSVLTGNQPAVNVVSGHTFGTPNKSTALNIDAEKARAFYKSHFPGMSEQDIANATYYANQGQTVQGGLSFQDRVNNLKKQYPDMTDAQARNQATQLLLAGVAKKPSLWGGIPAEVGKSSILSTGEQIYAQLKAEHPDWSEAKLQENIPSFAGSTVPTVANAINPYAGMTGAESQASAIQQISSSPLLQELTRQGEEALLQNASATGGVRGGNIQGVLAQYRPQMLQDAIEKQYARLAKISGLGQSSILSQPLSQPGGVPTNQNLPQLYQDIGSINAGSALASGQNTSNQIGAISKEVNYGLGTYLNRTPSSTAANVNPNAGGQYIGTDAYGNPIFSGL